MPSPYKVPKSPELLRFKPSHTLLFGVCRLPLTEHEAKRSTLQGKEVKMICTLVALSPAFGALLGFVYGPSINRALARLVTTSNTALAPA